METGIQCWNDKQPAVYILASKRNGTLYIGVTSDLQKRAWEHKQDLVDGFTKRYRPPLGLLRITRKYAFGYSKRETNQKVEPGMEIRIN